MQTLVALLLSILPQRAIEATPCEVLELNHVMRPGELEWEERFTQLIVWGNYDGGFYVRQWDMVHENELHIEPAGVLFKGRFYKAKVLSESWTGEDVEVRDRERMPYEKRQRVK